MKHKNEFYITPKGFAYLSMRDCGILDPETQNSEFDEFWEQFNIYLNSNGYLITAVQNGAEHNYELSNVKLAVDEILLEIGIPQSVVGYDIVSEAVVLAVTDHSYLKSAMKLYTLVASKLSISSHKAERIIRQSIERLWLRGDMEILLKYFKNSVEPERGKPTNKQFIARIVNLVENRLDANS